ncbi:verprolin-like isoform X1 [Acanthopagrus latus]|uniref:verprolin-like isoform X1 n=1 Tax=Acanthopagrus latus TaxID=8177 RepID=UPI00187C1E34|nr:verprolin-like isoform X1 [Acanthopagrus latus]
MPPKPPRKSYTMPSITSSYEVIQPTYEDPDATTPPVTDGSQSEVEVKPVPRPRSKLKPKADCNSSNNSTVDSIHKTSNTTNTEQVSQYSADCGKPRSVCPPPRPPPPSKKATSSQPKAEIATGSCYVNTVTALKSAAVSSESAPFPPSLPPKRPPPPAVLYDRPKSTMSPEPEMYIDEIRRSRCSSSSSMQHSTDSSALSDELVGLCGTYSSTVTDGTGRPVVPPRLPRSYSTCETLPLQTRPKVPSFSPPPPPSPEAPSESVYWEIESRPYLDILPEDNKEVIGQVGSSPFQSDRCTSNQQTASDTEDINTMLRWLKRVCKSDGMAPSLYGLSLEEEIRTFNQRALNLKKALRLYNLLMMKRCERLRDLIAEFSSISRSLDKMQKKTKTMGIAGGTTGAVGGVTAVLGIALAPVTMGTSLIATAVGAGMVASAGGMGAHTAKANKKIVGRMAVEKLVYEYKDKIVDLGHCLDFILSEMNELRRHDIPRLQRAGAQTDALKMAHLSQFVIKNNMNNAGKAFAGMSSERLLQAFAKEMDLYFSEKDCEKLKKSRESKFSGRVRLLAENLQDELDQMNRMWEMFN